VRGRADFHALRHTACTRMARDGMAMKHAQTLMRHADIRTTAAIYAHVTDRDLWAAVDGLTSLFACADVIQGESGSSDLQSDGGAST